LSWKRRRIKEAIMTEERTFRGEMLSRNPSKVAQAILAHFEGAPQPEEWFTEPYISWHSFEPDVEKIKRLHKPEAAAWPERPYAKSVYERVQVIDGDAAVTVLRTTKITTYSGREFKIEAAMIHLLNAEGKIHRVEAYYDPRELERDAWARVHLAMYDGAR
jgi:hypothetical protein